MEDSAVEDVCIMATDSNKVLDSPKPTAFTIDFDVGKTVDTQRHKSLVEKYQRRHRRGQSLSKIEGIAAVQSHVQKKPQSANMPRKSRTVKSPDVTTPEPCEEKSDKSKNVRSLNNKLRDGLTLPLKNLNSERMTQSCTLPCIDSPDIEVTDVSTPELEAVRPASPINRRESRVLLTPDNDRVMHETTSWVSGNDFDFDKSDAASDAGTYTLDADAYSEEQKARMSIDREFKIEAVSNLKKAQEYVQSLASSKGDVDEELRSVHSFMSNKLSPILSPTQHFSINSELSAGNQIECTKTLNKVMFPSPNVRAKPVDQGCVISVTSCGAFRPRIDRSHVRRLSLTKSDIHVEAYTDCKHITTEIQRPTRNLSANLVHVSDHNGGDDALQQSPKVLNLPPSVGGISGKISPSKIPSPIHSVRPRSRSSSNSLNVDLSDSSMETESYLRPTEKLLNTLQQRLSIESDADSDDGTLLNNDARNLLKNSTHSRHNSLDEKFLKISNKLEHFQNKMFIDQTNVLNQYTHHSKVQHKIQNSPNNSPIRRSSSFSTKNQIIAKCTNLPHKECNIRNSPNFARNGSIQRSASTAAMRSNLCRMSSGEPHKIDRSQYGDTESSSEEDLIQNNAKKKDITATRYNRAFSLRRARLDGDIANPSILPSPKCPNTPEMRRKFQPGNERTERAISVDRKPVKMAPEVQSRYLQNVTRSRAASQSKMLTTNAQVYVGATESMKSSPKIGNTATKPAPKAQLFSRSDAGRLSMRSSKPPMTNSQKTIRREVNVGHKKPTGPRSNSSLTSKEVDFQNWKRRKSYDPMKAAAEGKRKAEMARKQNVNSMTQSYHETNQDYDSSPSHSSSVHRSQSFHGTAALEHYLSSEDDDDLTLSADEGFSPPTPSPCEMSPNRANLRYAWKEH